MDTTLLERMFELEVRVGEIIHIKGMLPDTESPPECFEEFAESWSYDVRDDIDRDWPGYAKRIEAIWDESEGEDWLKEEIAFLFAQSCPKTFLVRMSSCIGECLIPDTDHECSGTWASGWGYFSNTWRLVDSIEEAIKTECDEQHKRRVGEWNRALEAKSKATGTGHNDSGESS